MTVDLREAAALGASLRRIDQDFMKSNSAAGATKVWYQGGEPYFDVFLELHGHEIAWFQFTLRGKSLSWNRQQERLKTGKTNELDAADFSFFAASKTVQDDPDLDLEFLALVKTILQARPEEALFQQTLRLLDGAA